MSKKKQFVPTFKGRKHTPEARAKLSEAMKRLYADKRPKGMGFARKYYAPGEAKSAWSTMNRQRQLKCRYGITVEQYDAMLKEQSGGCAVCSAKSAYKNKSAILHVDHCHVTGRVRGLLCSNCNTAIGRFEEIGVLRFIQYLAPYSSHLEVLIKRPATSLPASSG